MEMTSVYSKTLCNKSNTSRCLLGMVPAPLNWHPVYCCAHFCWALKPTRVIQVINILHVCSVPRRPVGPRVRYRASGAPENACPLHFSPPCSAERPAAACLFWHSLHFSPPCPAERPAAACLFWHSLPLCPLRPQPYPYPRRVPVRNVW